MNFCNGQYNIDAAMLSGDFNQDASCLTVGTIDGFKVYTTSKFAPAYVHKVGGVSICEMLFNTSLVVVVGSGDDPAFTSRKVRVINLITGDNLCELNFVTPVLNVRLNRRRMAVVLETKIHIYDSGTMKIIHSIDTVPNPKGICVLSPDSTNCYLVFPASNERGSLVVFDALALQAVSVIPAHTGPVAKLAINQNGTMIASCSTKGTVIRVLDIGTATCTYQFRRGSYPASIYCLAFSPDNQFLAVSSDTGTVHIFKIDSNASVSTTRSSGSVLGVSSYWSGVFTKSVNEMWDSMAARSFAWLKLPAGVENIIAFNQKGDVVMIVLSTGVFLEYNMDPKVGGELKVSKEYTFLATNDAPVHLADP